ncbi:MAG: bifunctional DNA-formamidopyrimidine glycosylase/DNA-(apurinic or apyrimidinic site) lyase [Pyrinomonadaceae bacterium]
MPELPEIELVAVALRNDVLEKTITRAELLREKLAPDDSPKVFSERLQNVVIKEVYRRGKYLVVKTDSEFSLLVHLRMTGKFNLLNENEENPKHTHAEFVFNSGNRLAFVDQRHFGFMKTHKTAKLVDYFASKKLAPEPFSDQFSGAYLRNVTTKSKSAIKDLLLNQQKVCGLGNIYAAEALHLAGIHPTKPANKISLRKINLLYDAIIRVLTEAVEFGNRTTFEINSIENGYINRDEGWLVYDREGKPCFKCEKTILRAIHHGRSNFFCPNCQRK